MLPPNTQIGQRYTILRLLGQGGMSNLYLCKDRRRNDQVCVIKEMTAIYSDPKEQELALQLFHREAKLLASLNHRHIPKVYDYFQFRGSYYLAMEFVEGEDLGKKLSRITGGLPEKEVAELGAQMATVLYYLHVHKPPIVFRDVKPSNIMMTRDGVKLIDFGIARMFNPAKKGDTMRIGSPGYAPPEQYSGQTDPRSDIYALGVTLHHALTGRDPTSTQTPFLVPPIKTLNPAVSDEMAAIVTRATQLDPDNRYQSMLEMKRDLAALTGRGQRTQPHAGPVSPASSTRPHAGPAPVPTTSPQPPVAAGQPQPVAVAGAPATGQPATAAPPKKKRRFPVGMLAFVLLLLGSVGAAVMFPNLVTEGRNALADLVHGLFAPTVPTEPIEAGLFIYRGGGSLEAAYLRFQQALEEAPEDPKALAMAASVLAEMTGRPTTTLALVYPEERAGEVLAGAALAQRLVNAQGGVSGTLLTLAPVPYATGRLEATLRDLEAGRFGRQTAEGPAAPPDRVAVWAAGDEVPETSLPMTLVGPGGLADPGSGLDTAVASLSPSRVLWLSPEPVEALESAKVPLERAEAAEPALLKSAGTVVVPVDQAEPLLEADGEGTLLLVADHQSQLPEKVRPGTLALVRFSQFSSARFGAGLVREHQHLFEETAFGSDLARSFDATLAAVLGGEGRLEGATLMALEPAAVAAPWNLFAAGAEGWRFQKSTEVAGR